MSISSSKSAEILAASNVYALLGRLWVAEVDRVILRELKEPRFASDFTLVDNENEDAVVETLAAEYCALFIGPKNHFPPMQSVWQEGQLDSEITNSVKEFADAINYKPAKSYPGTQMDHLGIEMELMGRIVECIGRQKEDESHCQDTHEFAGEFFRRHLTWTGRLFSTAIAHSDSVFYKSLLQTTRDFLQTQSEMWGEVTQA